MLPASIEMSVKQAITQPDLSTLIPAGTHVYLTDLGGDDNDALITAAARLHSLGLKCVPHLAVRRLASKDALERRISRLAQEASITSFLVIAGGIDPPKGPFASTLMALQTGFFEKHGIKTIGVAGHPETSPDFSDEIAQEALRQKQVFAQTAGLDMHIVTQFGFDGQKFCDWAESLHDQGITLPVHLGLAGPAKLPTILKFAVMCGVGNSLQLLRKKSNSILSLAAGFDPDEIAAPIETHVSSRADTAIERLHVFPFGGLKGSAQWLRTRGNWN